MAGPFKFELVSPERLLLSEEALQVDLPGTDGDFGILEGHSPFISTLRPGVAVITLPGGSIQKFFVRGGLAEVSAAGLTVLAEKAIALSDLKADEIAQEVKNAEEDVADAATEMARQAAEMRLAQMKDLANALKAA
ncbi:F-ATPase epsilon subunit [Hartmannibacter diazotrophicus]|uniref:ATP synthase epsilon chain n=1 Tax=Hartmannibacter diazotrophicus TaxID=1482074 RepID=A0A2C9DBB6_9HYPH|nr:F0F1 ATP synthase subunit epsilon [Hartmannibacter diazotrophicus]SON57523.1 F-ATPase epsilon subunit [Hartmannibacter diazotrophicus]